MTVSELPAPFQRTNGRSAEARRRVLVVGDGNATVAPVLGRGGCDVLAVRSAEEARPLIFGQHQIELAILDRRLPDLDGRELCREIRAANGPPVVLIGEHGGEAELVDCLQTGAEDYLAPPFGNAELLARVRAVLRRTRPATSPPAARTIGPLVVDPSAHLVTVDGKRLALTPREYAVLLALVARPEQVVPREEIFVQAWGPGWLGSTKALDMQISALRRKLGESPEHPRLIHTVRGVGFMVAPPE